MLNPPEKRFRNDGGMTLTRNPNSISRQNISCVELVCQNFVNVVRGRETAGFVDFELNFIIFLREDFLLGSAATHRRHGETLLNGKACDISQAPPFHGDELGKPENEWGSDRIMGLCFHRSQIEITDGSL